MRTELTSEELELVEKHIASLEKRDKAWPRKRWWRLIRSLAFMGGSLAAGYVIHLTVGPMVMEMLTDLPSVDCKGPVDCGHAQLLASRRFMGMQLMGGVFLMPQLLFIFGLLDLVLGLVLWRQHIPDGAMTKFHRAMLERMRENHTPSPA